MPGLQQQHHSFGELVRRRRRALELTQQQLAQRASCSEDMVRKIEADMRRPSRWLAERLLKQLQIDGAEQPAFLKAARLGSSVSARPPALPVAAAPVVGRTAEIATLRRHLAAAQQGQGSLVLIEGEPGIGKSYLAQAALAEAAAAGFLTCAIGCYEIDRAIPLQPLIEWTRRLLDLLGPQVIDLLSPGAQAELAELAPQVRELRPALPPSTGAPELRRTRIFQAIVELTLARLPTAPMLVVVDDIHWADETTLPLLHNLVKQARSQRLLVVCTLRSEELAGNEALALFVQSAVAGLGATRLPLARWSADEMQALMAGLVLRADLADRLRRNSEGHPLYLSSMLQQLQDHPAATPDETALALPPALRDSIRERLRRLPPPARAVIDIAAVLGRRFDFFALERGAGIAGGALADTVELLQQRQLLREVDGGASFDFTHDKIREVVYDDLGSARRIVLHRRAADALAESEGDNPAVIAEHNERAGQWDAAVRHHELAARRSLGLSALREAGRAVERAQALARQHPSAADAATNVRLHERGGDVHAQDGRSTEAVAAFEAALAGARALGDASWTCDLLAKLGMALRRADDYAGARDCLGQALAAARALDEPQRIADTLYHLGTVAWSEGDNTLAMHCHGEAVQLCETHALRGLVAVQAYHGAGEGFFTFADPRRAIECFERSLTLAQEQGDRGYEAENLTMLGYCCSGSMGLADYARADAFARQSIAVIESAEQQWHLAPVRMLQADLWRCVGRIGDAQALLNAELQRIDQIDQPRFGIMALDMLGRLLHEQGRDAEAQDAFGRAIDSGDGRRIDFWRAQVLAGFAQARLHQKLQVDWTALQGASDTAVRRADRCGHARCLEVLAEGALQEGNAAGARAQASRLLELAAPAGMDELAALAHWLLGRSWADEAPQRAEPELAAASKTAERIGRPWLAWHARSALADLCDRLRRRSEAAAHRAAALTWRQRLQGPSVD